MLRIERRSAGICAAAAVSALLCLLIYGCGGGGTATSPTTLRVSLTDKPTPAFAAVVVAIKEVRVVPAGSEEALSSSSGLPVIATYSIPRSVNVLDLKFQQEVLKGDSGVEDVVLPPGEYSQVRLVLAPNTDPSNPVNYVVLANGEVIPLKTPSGQESGLKIPGKFTVKAGQANAIMLDFDPATAVVDKGNEGYNLKPTGIRIIELAGSIGSYGSIIGTVSGFAPWSTATFSVVPAGRTGSIAAGTVFSHYTSGTWSAPLSAFAPAGNYKLFLRSGGFATYSTGVVSVTAGAESDAGTLPLVPTP